MTDNPTGDLCTDKMSTKELLQAHANGEISTEQRDAAIDKKDSLLSAAKAAEQAQPVFNNNAHFFTKLTSLSSHREANAPRKLYISGPGIDAVSKPRSAYETDEAYYSDMSSVHGHLSSLLWLMTIGAETFLNTILPNIGKPELAYFKSKFPNSPPYPVIVAQYGNTDCYVQLSSRGDLGEAEALLRYAEQFKNYVNKHDIDPFPVLQNNVYFGETPIASPVTDISGIPVPTVVPEPEQYDDKYTNHVDNETADQIDNLL